MSGVLQVDIAIGNPSDVAVITPLVLTIDGRRDDRWEPLSRPCTPPSCSPTWHEEQGLVEHPDHSSFDGLRLRVNDDRPSTPECSYDDNVVVYEGPLCP